MKPCKKCKGTGRWAPDAASEYDDAHITSKERLRCDGTGQVLTIEEDKAESRLEERRKIVEGKPSGQDLPAAPTTLPPRRAHCQITPARKRGEPGGDLGTVAWEEHVAACKARGTDPERMMVAGGWDYAALTLLLGREPATWKAW